MSHTALLALEDGSLFYGSAFGFSSSSPLYTVGEVVFNTSMTGYQEILTDPSYTNQIIALTYPHIGNTGINAADQEGSPIRAKGLVIHQLARLTSNWRSQESLETFLIRHKTFGIQGVDVRRLTRLLREKGALKGCIVRMPLQSTMGPLQVEEALAQARTWPGLVGMDLAKQVSVGSAYRMQETVSQTHSWHVAVYDFGVKKSILNCLTEQGCQVTVVPAKTPASEILEWGVDGVVFSNGPGDPAVCDYAIEAAQFLLARSIPILGICLGHQILALACGAKTFKMKQGHHGANHPVRCEKDKHVLITSQNHGFAVDEQDLPDCLEITHRSLFDGTIQGFEHRDKPALGFQGHPEAGPGPTEAKSFFKEFITLMQEAKKIPKAPLMHFETEIE